MDWSRAEDVNNEVLQTVNEALGRAYLSCGIELQRHHVEHRQERRKQYREPCRHDKADGDDNDLLREYVLLQLVRSWARVEKKR